jgi:hypothetical protein
LPVPEPKSNTRAQVALASTFTQVEMVKSFNALTNPDGRLA